MRRFVPVIAMLLASACAREQGGVPALTVLSGENARNFDPSFSPDGSRIAYWSPSPDVANQSDLWVANADLTSPVKAGVTSLSVGPALWSPDGTRLAAASSQFGTADVVVVPATGGQAQRVTHLPGIAYPYAWYPDGDRIAIGASDSGNFHSYSVSVSSDATKPLIPGERRAYQGSPSPDGAHVGYMVVDRGRSTIWVADSDGTNPRQLTTEGFESPANDFWSPDSREILYESRRTGTEDVWTVSIESGERRQLTRDVRRDYGEAWSPDGKWVAFLSDRGRQIDVWLVPAAGGPVQRVTDSESDEQGPLAWRPHANELAFAVRSSNGSVWAQELTDGKERQLTPDSLDISWFNLSPDGKQFDYVVNRSGGTGELFVASLDGSTPPRSVFSGGGNVDSPLWSPDGSRIAFVSDRNGSPDVWVVDAAGGAAKPLVSWTSQEFSAAWSPDGSSILFLSDSGAKLADLWRVPAQGGDPTHVTTDGLHGGFVGTRAGVPDILIGTLGRRGGVLTLTRVGADGRVHPVWEKSNVPALGALRPSGDSVLARIQQADGSIRTMLLALDGSGGRVVLGAGETGGNWSPDGKSLLYYIRANGAPDLGLLDVASGAKRRLTTTPQSEEGAEFTPDGKQIVFTRLTISQRIETVDLTRLMQAPK